MLILDKTDTMLITIDDYVFNKLINSQNTKPLDEKFEIIWDSNIEQLYED